MNTPVNFELAKLLKEKGFDEITQNLWHFNGSDCIKMTNKNCENLGFSAPTIAEIVIWLYENHKFWIVAFPIEDGFWAFDVFDSKSECIKSGMEFNSPTKAYEAAIEYTLNKLIWHKKKY